MTTQSTLSPRDQANARRRRERRTQILRAGKTVFSRQGYHATTMAEVAAAADLSYGTLYWYFASKEDLFDALMQQQELALRRWIDAALDPIGPSDAEARLRAAVRATFEFFEQDREAVKLLFRDSSTLDDRFERHLFRIYERFVDDLESSIEAAHRRGELISYPPRVIAFCIAALVGQLAHRRLVTDDGLDTATISDFVVSLLLDGLRPRASADVGPTDPPTTAGDGASP